MRSLHVKYLSNAAIDVAVRELLAKFAKWRGGPVTPPVPVEDIVEKYLRVSFEVVDLQKLLGVSDVLGAAWFNENVIRIDERIENQEGRFAFTVAHETAHWLLHRPLYEAEKVARTLYTKEPDAPAMVCRTSQRKASAEIQADAFAARLLMPEPSVRETFRALQGDAPVEIPGVDDRSEGRPVLASWRDLAEAVIHHGGFTNVSNEAMRYRLRDLDLVCERSPVVRSLF